MATTLLILSQFDDVFPMNSKKGPDLNNIACKPAWTICQKFDIYRASLAIFVQLNLLLSNILPFTTSIWRQRSDTFYTNLLILRIFYKDI